MRNSCANCGHFSYNHYGNAFCSLVNLPLNIDYFRHACTHFKEDKEASRLLSLEK